MIPSDDERKWLNNAIRYGGTFVKSFAECCFNADDENFKLLQPVLVQLMQKYLRYSENRRFKIL